MADGRLYYVVGASGVGKDTLLQYARAHLGEETGVVFAHRYITRPHGTGGENHVALSGSEFSLRKQYGAFAMDWATHGFRYGIGREIHYWLATGLSVVVNGSREYLSAALDSYPDMMLIWLTASPEIIAQRLDSRARESAQDIARRINRGSVIPMPARPHASMVTLDNSGPVEVAGDALVRLLEGAPQHASSIRFARSRPEN